jgi:hypothetical protein
MEMCNIDSINGLNQPMGQHPAPSLDQGSSAAPSNTAGEAPFGAEGESPFDAAIGAPLDYTGEAPFGAAGEAPFGAEGESPFDAAIGAPLDYAGEAPFGAAGEAPFDPAGAAPSDTAGGVSSDPMGEAISNAANAAASDTAGETSSDAAGGASAAPEVVNETIEVKAGETFDGNNQTYTAGSALGDGSQDEGQKPIFRLEEGATLQNVVIGDNGADGVHVYGDAVIDNVHWTDVGEDALTIKASGSDGIADVQITNSSARNADDKIFQVNADANLTIENFEAENFGKLVRTNGGQQGHFEINLNDITAKNGTEALVRSDAEGIVINASNISTENVKQDWILPDSAIVNQS